VRDNRITLVLLVLFFVAAGVFVLYLASVRLWLHDALPVAFFWVPLLLMAGLILFQLVGYPRFDVRIILLEVLVLGALLHSILKIPYFGLYDSDSYELLMTVVRTLEHGVATSPVAEIRNELWPALVLWAALLVQVSGLDPFAVVRWSPVFLNLLFLVLLFLLFRNIYPAGGPVALLAVLLLACLEPNVTFGSAFTRTAVALVVFATILLLFQVVRRERIQFEATIGLILGLIALAFTHHLTAFMALVFLLVHPAVVWWLGFLRGRGPSPAGTAPTFAPGATVITLFFTATFAYWIYAADAGTFTVLVRFLESLFTADALGVGTYGGQYYVATHIVSLRGYVLYWGFYLFHVLFAGLLAYGLLRRHRFRRPESYSFAIFLGVCAGLAAIQMFVMPRTMVDAGPFRFVFLGWVLGFGVLAECIWRDYRGWCRRVCFAVVGMFIVYNFIALPPEAWNPNAPGRPTNVLLEDYHMAEALTWEGEGAAFKNGRLAIYHVSGVRSQPLGYHLNMPAQLDDLDWLVLDRREIQSSLELLEHGKYPGSVPVLERIVEYAGAKCHLANRIYESEHLVVLRHLRH